MQQVKDKDPCCLCGGLGHYSGIGLILAQELLHTMSVAKNKNKTNHTIEKKKSNYLSLC